MKGNPSMVGKNRKSVESPASVEKGSDPKPRGTGQLASESVSLNLKEFSRTKSTSCGVEKSGY